MESHDHHTSDWSAEHNRDRLRVIAALAYFVTIDQLGTGGHDVILFVMSISMLYAKIEGATAREIAQGEYRTQTARFRNR